MSRSAATCYRAATSRLHHTSATHLTCTFPFKNGVQETAFGRHTCVHYCRISVGGVAWYKERVVMKTTLGSLLTVVLLRTAHHNLAKLRVLHLRLLLVFHTNHCRATT